MSSLIGSFLLADIVLTPHRRLFDALETLRGAGGKEQERLKAEIA